MLFNGLHPYPKGSTPKIPDEPAKSGNLSLTSRQIPAKVSKKSLIIDWRFTQQDIQYLLLACLQVTKTHP